ncbi:membrane protein DedA with SNARE-associated domain [Catenuloplanes atrovinosus]|uniref:Membrane protein DedA with SNARE-associated domain n=1 Tax=Catenuloplanes atrovinosus TaxID=137266 RepID=A0AAE3YQP4_9ACTN|nr:membrane protein DedA with SNARE-associated domain [Catenuloplanes atrovinosus]
MDGLVEPLAGLPATLVYLAAAGLVMVETASLIGLLLPAEATLLLVGFLAAQGRLHLGVALVSMITAAAVGDSLAFRAGRRYGPRLRATGPGRRVGAARWERADALMARYGGRAMLVARWVAFVRTLAPRLAGAGGLPYRRFLPWNLAGVAGWVGASVLAGYLAGESYRRMSAVLGGATGALLVLAVIAVALTPAGRALRRRRERSGDVGNRRCDEDVEEVLG